MSNFINSSDILLSILSNFYHGPDKMWAGLSAVISKHLFWTFSNMSAFDHAYSFSTSEY